MIGLSSAIAKPTNQPHATYLELEKLVDKTIGIKLFTLMELDHERNVAWRSYSNMPDAYPTLGEKPRKKSSWTHIVDDRHETFVANTIDEIASVFPDHELILSLGCESCMNIPIVIHGKLRGTLNCLHEAGHFTPERVAASENLKTAGAVAFLFAESIRNQGTQYE